MRLTSLLVILLCSCGGRDPMGVADADLPGLDGAIDANQPDAGNEGLCGGFTGATCADDEWCDFADNGCGVADGIGVCRPRPQGCDEIYDPVCACDGSSYGNACLAEAAGSDVNKWGACVPAPGNFGCGERYCATDVHYCLHVVSDVVGFPDEFECRPLPDSCPTPATGACVDEEPCGESCAASPAGHITLTCGGG